MKYFYFTPFYIFWIFKVSQVVSCTHLFTCLPTTLCFWKGVNNALKWKTNALGVWFCKTLMTFTMCFLRMCENHWKKDRPMATHKLGNFVFNHPPFCFQFSYWLFYKCWSLIIVMLLHHIPKCCWFLSIA
jgi:hypothetical protein